MISLHEVTKEYRLGDKATLVPVRQLNLEISKGEFVIIIGRSGCGKSTLLNLTAGLIKPTSGKVIVQNQDLSKMSEGEISRWRSQRLGFIFQFPSLLPSLNVIENIILPSVFNSQPKKQEFYTQATRLLDILKMNDKADVYPRQLSAGEQRRAAIARSLFNHPEIVLADEPTSDLDEQTEREVMNLLRQINDSGVTLLMVTHNLQLIHESDRTFKMENGSLTLMN